jgi:hypothetical protein
VSKRKLREVFAKVVCVNAPSAIAAALCLAGLLSASVLSAFLPGLWSLAGLTAVLLIAGLPFLGRWSRREFLLESRLGIHGPNSTGNRASVPKCLPARCTHVFSKVTMH